MEKRERRGERAYRGAERMSVKKLLTCAILSTGACILIASVSQQANITISDLHWLPIASYSILKRRKKNNTSYNLRGHLSSALLIVAL